jgi:hypothetical protein
VNHADLITWSPGVTLESIEHQVIIRAYDYYKKNNAATARALGIDVRTLKAKLDKYDADGKERERLAEIRRQENENFLARSRGLPPVYDMADKPMPLPQNGINPTNHVVKEPAEVKKTPSVAPPEPPKAQEQKKRRA